MRNKYPCYFFSLMAFVLIVSCTSQKATILEQRPTIIKSLPRDGAVNVAVNINEIVVTFDRTLHGSLRVITYAREYSNLDSFWRDNANLSIRIRRELKPFSRYRVGFEFEGYPDYQTNLTFFTGPSKVWRYHENLSSIILFQSRSTEIASWLDRSQIEEAHAEINERFRYRSHYRIPILIYPDNNAFQKEMNCGGQAILFNKAIICLNPEIISYYSDNGEYFQNIFRVIKHEYTHFVVREHTKAQVIPILIDEGLAEYIANRMPPYVRSAYLGIGEDLLVEALERNALLDWSILLRSDYQFFHDGPAKTNATNLKLMSSQTFSFVAYLIDAYGFNKILNLLEGLSKGTDLKNVFTGVYGLKFDEIVLNWKQNVIKEVLLK